MSADAVVLIFHVSGVKRPEPVPAIIASPVSSMRIWCVKVEVNTFRMNWNTAWTPDHLNIPMSVLDLTNSLVNELNDHTQPRSNT